ncbi:V-type proton ATPase subunit d2 [Zea mays]|uniref:V-type proton ATPase subunit d2 n=1 Tax=Zea mays TaxID=4577 RepID=A0A1D6FYA0_MAIZE|nr:V-type proton ATPase subunit d2 [Zea mays]
MSHLHPSTTSSKSGEIKVGWPHARWAWTLARWDLAPWLSVLARGDAPDYGGLKPRMTDDKRCNNEARCNAMIVSRSSLEPSPLHTTTIVEKCTLKLVDDYKHMLCQATEPLSTFLQYITLVLVDTPLAPYFSECITSEDLDDMNIEIMRNLSTKHILRTSTNFARYPYGHEELVVCEDVDQVRSAMEKYPPYQSIFSRISYGKSQMLDKAFYEEEVKRLCLSFEQLREQEIRNLMWISECVAQNQKSQVHDSVVFIF